MTQESESSESLYGKEESEPKAPTPPTPGLLDQIVGVFTSPGTLFEQMRPAPKWLGAILLMAALGLTLSLLWAFRADFELLIRETLERQGKPIPDGLESIAAIQKKFSVFGTIGAVLVGVPLVTAASAGVLLLLGQQGAEGEVPTYRQCLAADVVPTLVKLPQVILTLVAIAFRDVGGATPDKLIPTSLAFWIHPENVKVAAMLTWVDPFAIAYGVIYALALRHLLHLKWGFAIGTVAVWCLIKFAVGMVFAR
jgi:hypothetical protein